MSLTCFGRLSKEDFWAFLERQDSEGKMWIPNLVDTCVHQDAAIQDHAKLPDMLEQKNIDLQLFC